ncbi:hypothetical protein DMN91_000081 [Ooceraea biroi]|uniref:Uncharacterized protein n=1 Tax=Ooceraea biroi TaxID=2015173 RepID=A0A3L8E0U8_OOCBI|nr:hypothetical protein DMN91_000081 [Ooceraea biroi]
MSDEEVFDVNDVDVNEEDDEYNVSMKEELIALVKANPALYAKNWKSMLVKSFAKTWLGRVSDIACRSKYQGKTEGRNICQRKILIREEAPVCAKMASLSSLFIFGGPYYASQV